MALLLAYVFAQIVIAIIVGLVYALYLAFADAHLDTGHLAKRLQAPAVLLSAGTLGVLGGALLVVYMTRRFFTGTPRREAYEDLGLTRASPQNYLLAAILGISLALVYVFLAIHFLHPGHKPPVGLFARAAAGGGFPRVLLAILAVVIAPPIEEFLFRGAMYAGFEKTWGRSTAVLLVTVTFVLLHVSEVRTFWPGLVGIATTALVLAAVRVRSGSLGPPIMLHAYYNLGLVFAGFTYSGRS
ncbi:MAG TPA: CPBP family intramembrane glutamic endopeptidase [Gemmatimonadales bacterium]